MEVNLRIGSFHGECQTLYECVRKYWRLKGDRAAKADVVFGTFGGVFRPIKWYPLKEYVGSSKFEGEKIFIRNVVLQRNILEIHNNPPD